MSLIGGKGFLIAFFSLVKVLISNVLMSTECVGVSKLIVNLNGSIEEFKSGFVFFLKGIAVTYYAPGLRSEKWFFKRMIR